MARSNLRNHRVHAVEMLSSPRPEQSVPIAKNNQGQQNQKPPQKIVNANYCFDPQQLPLVNPEQSERDMTVKPKSQKEKPEFQTEKPKSQEEKQLLRRSSEEKRKQRVFEPVEKGNAKWEEDSQRTSCSKCRFSFTWLQRRHHCRACGKIFCDEHVLPRRKIQISGTADNLFVEQQFLLCDNCHASYDYYYGPM